MSELSNIRISGSGSCKGGLYDNISISGSGKINGDVKCNSINISGSGKVLGGIECQERISISGAANFDGDIVCGEFHDSGSAKVSGNLTAKSFHISGVYKSGGRINSDVIAVAGIVKTEGDITGEMVAIRGGVDTDKLISGDNVEIEFDGFCRIGELGGGTINVRRKVKQVRNLGFFFSKSGVETAEIGSIEADDINISDCNVRTVVGAKVVIGPGCHVKRVEYSQDLKIDPSSKVEETVCNR